MIALNYHSPIKLKCNDSFALSRVYYNPNPDIENTMIEQVLDAPRKPRKSFITNEVTLVFLVFLCTSVTCTLKRIFISGFGYKVFVCFLIFLFNFSVAAQNTNHGIEKYIPATTYTIKNGLSSNSVQGVLQDEKGFIWLATSKGLSRFDSSEFINFTKNKLDKYSLPEISVENIMMMPDNHIWMTISDIGVSIFDEFDFKSQHIKNSQSVLFKMPNSNLYGMAKDKNNNVWFSLYGEGIYQWDIDKQEFNKFLQSDENAWLHSKKTFELFIDSQNRLWICTIDSFVYMYDIDKGVAHEYNFAKDKNDPLTNPIYGFTQSKTGAIYAGGYSGVYKFNDDKNIFENIIKENTLTKLYDGEHTSVRRILMDSQNNLWVGTFSSLLLYSNQSLKKVNFFQNNEMINPDWKTHSILESRDGNIWIGTDGQGLIKLAPDWDRYNIYFSPEPEPQDILNSFQYENDIWIIHPSSKMDLFSLTNGHLDFKRTLKPDLGRDYLNIDHLHQDNPNYIWISSIQGIHKVDVKTGVSKAVTDENGQELGSVRQFYRAIDGQFYFNYFSENTIAYYNETEMVAHKIQNTAENHFNGNTVSKIALGLDSKIWFASNYGIESLDIQTKNFEVVYKPPDGQIIKSFLFDGNNVWVIIDGALSLFKWDKNKLTPLDEKYRDILPIVNFKDLLRYKNNVLIISTDDNGLVELNTKTLEYKIYNVENGLPSNIIKNVLFPDENPMIFTQSGVALHNKNFKNKVFEKPQLVFDEIEINRTKLKNIQSTVILPYDFDTLKFDMALLSYKNKETIEYEYQLKGLSEKWINTGNDDTYSFLRLNAGDYTFNVKGRSNFGQWSDTKYFSFKVKPPPWKTWWAYILYGLATFAFLYWIMYLYKRKLLYENEITKQQAKQEIANAASKAKSDFLARVSHEIRTPLNGVLGMSELMLDTQMNEEQKIYADSINSSGKHLLGIINDILDLSKIEAGKLTLEEHAFDLLSLIDEVVASFTSQVKTKNILFTCVFNPRLVRNRVGDEIRIKQVLFNLLSNAFKFTKEGEIKLKVTLANKNKPEQVKFMIKDSGIGIDEPALKDLFQPFVQADSAITRKYGGTGLGLAIVKQLSEKMNGNITASSRVKKGSMFTAILALKIDSSVKITESKTSNKCVCLMTNQESIKQSVTQYLTIMNVPFCLELNQQTNCLFIDTTTKLDVQQMQNIENVRNKDIEIIFLSYHSDNIDFANIQMSKTQSILTDTKSNSKSIGLPLTFKKLNDVIFELNHNVTNYYVSSFVQSRSLKILVVEDNAINQQVSIEMLEKMGHLVDIVDNAEEALIMLYRYQFDVLLLDYHLPGMDGFSMLEKWNNTYNVPIILVTADLTDEVYIKSKKQNIQEVIAKPFTLQQLSTAIESVIKNDT